jgi:hypothetical protein
MMSIIIKINDNIGMSSREQEVRTLLTVLAQKVVHTREALKAQEVGNALYGLKRMSSDVLEVRQLIDALVPKVTFYFLSSSSSSLLLLSS